MLVRFYELSPVILLSLYEMLYRRHTEKYLNLSCTVVLEYIFMTSMFYCIYYIGYKKPPKKPQQLPGVSDSV